MSIQPSNDELYRLILRVEGQMEKGFVGTHDRLDLLNGRVRTNELRLNSIEVKGKVFAGLMSGALALLGLFTQWWKG